MGGALSLAAGRVQPAGAAFGTARARSQRVAEPSRSTSTSARSLNPYNSFRDASVAGQAPVRKASEGKSSAAWAGASAGGCGGGSPSARRDGTVRVVELELMEGEGAAKVNCKRPRGRRAELAAFAAAEAGPSEGGVSPANVNGLASCSTPGVLASPGAEAWKEGGGVATPLSDVGPDADFDEVISLAPASPHGDDGAHDGPAHTRPGAASEEGRTDARSARHGSYVDWYRSGSFKGDEVPERPPPDELAELCRGGGGGGEGASFFPPPAPANEDSRVGALWALRILDTGLEESFQRLAELAQELFDVPIALVSLVDSDRQWFKARCGLAAPETGRDVSFCGHSILLQGPEPLVVRNALEDWRFAANPLVTGAPHIRFYAGAPLRLAGGATIGTLCIIDRKAREFEGEQQRRLAKLAAIALREIELYGSAQALLFRSATEESIASFSRRAIASGDPCRALALAAETVASVLTADVAFVAAGPAPPSGAGALPLALQLRAPGGDLGPVEEAEGFPLGPATLAELVDEAPGAALHLPDPLGDPRCPSRPPSAPPASAPAPSLPWKSGRGRSRAGLISMAGAEGAGRRLCYLGAFSCDPRRRFADDVRAYLARFGAALEAVLGQCRARRALEESEGQLRREKERADRLIRNTLPEAVAAKLIEESSPIADLYEETTIVFADIVGFTELSSRLSAPEVAQMLNRIFSCLDRTCATAGCEKIKTIGDCYMAAAGVPQRREGRAGAEAALEFAIGAVAAVKRFNEHFGTAIALRIGVHSGPVVAGVIGTSRYIFDLWGDTVNVAARMESTGLPGRIQVSEATHALVAERYTWSRRGPIVLKGKAGEAVTFLYEGRLGGDARGIPSFDARALDDSFWHMEVRRASFVGGM
eukprot:tig00000754_g3918.t1